MGFARKSYYEILDIDPGASPEEIQRAYRLVRTTFSPDSIATYSLYTPTESTLIARKLEEAFQILTDPTRRGRYDAYLRFMNSQQAGPEQSRPETPKAFFEQARGSLNTTDPSKITELLTETPLISDHPTAEIAPATQLGSTHLPHPDIEREWEEVLGCGPMKETAQPKRSHTDSPPKLGLATPLPAAKTPPPQENKAPTQRVWARARISDTGVGWRRPNTPKLTPRPPLQEKSISPGEIADLESRLGLGGAFLRAVREKKGIPLSEIATRTKIGQLYLQNIENEAFSELPPAVYLRGFVTNYVRLLKLDQVRVVSAYLARFETAVNGGESPT